MKGAVRFAWVAVMAAVVSCAQALTYEEVETALQATEMHVMTQLDEARRALRREFRRIGRAQNASVTELLASTESMVSKWATLSELYVSLSNEDGNIYEGLLDTYFSTAGDLYEYIESNVSPWYDRFDAEQIWDYRFYALVDSYDVLYERVDHVNHAMYDKADDEFEALYDQLEEVSYYFDSLASSASRDVAESITDMQTAQAGTVTASQTAAGSHAETRAAHQAAAMDRRRQLSERSTISKTSLMEGIQGSEEAVPSATVIGAVVGSVAAAMVVALTVQAVMLRRISARLADAESKLGPKGTDSSVAPASVVAGSFYDRHTSL